MEEGINMERSITRTRNKRYCKATIRLTYNGDGVQRLSITGEMGRIVSKAAARKDAKQYWVSFFEDSPEEIFAMNERCGTRFSSASGAAKYVLDMDGEYHGLDAEEVDGKVYVGDSFGCIHNDIAEWFPELVPLIRWHLNDMNSTCECQDRHGWHVGMTIALTKDTLTPAQRKTIDDDLFAACSSKRGKEFDRRWAEIMTSDYQAQQAIRLATGRETITISDMEDLRSQCYPHRPLYKQVHSWMLNKVREEIQPEVFEAEIFKDGINAPCPDCGHRMGSKWLVRELPPEIVELAKTALKDEERS